MRYRLTAHTITVVRETGPRAVQQLSDPATAASVALSLIPDDDREHLIALALDAQNRLIGASRISIGGQSATITDPKPIARYALLSGASAIILAHNHPSGDPEPSREDQRITRTLREALALLEIRLHDHLIVCHAPVDPGKRFVSLSQKGVI